MRLPFFGKVPNEHLFSDSQLWEMEEEEGNEGSNLGAHGTNGSYGTLGITNTGMELRNEKGIAEKNL